MTDPNPDSLELSIIVVTYNSRRHVRDCLESVQQAAGDINHEVIVVDNASQDGTPDIIRNEFPDAHLIANPENLGFARGNNQGISQSQGTDYSAVESGYRSPAENPRHSAGGNESVSRNRALGVPFTECRPQSSTVLWLRGEYSERSDPQNFLQPLGEPPFPSRRLGVAFPAFPHKRGGLGQGRLHAIASAGPVRCKIDGRNFFPVSGRCRSVPTHPAVGLAGALHPRSGSDSFRRRKRPVQSGTQRDWNTAEASFITSKNTWKKPTSSC